MAEPVCATRPGEWWETGNDGNRLAIALCRRCPLSDRCPALDGQGRAFGMVAAGQAWSDYGHPLTVCSCGQPVMYASPRGTKRRLCDACAGKGRTVPAEPDPRWRQPCGTPAAAMRHWYHGEPPCDACRQAERARDRARKARSRARGKAA